MTKVTREKIIVSVGSAILAFIFSIVLYSFTTKMEDGRSLKKTVVDIDKNKADITYVDTKCNEIKTDLKNDIIEVNNNLREIRAQNSEILRLLATERR